MGRLSRRPVLPGTESNGVSGQPPPGTSVALPAWTRAVVRASAGPVTHTWASPLPLPQSGSRLRGPPRPQPQRVRKGRNVQSQPRSARPDRGTRWPLVGGAGPRKRRGPPPGRAAQRHEGTKGQEGPPRVLPAQVGAGCGGPGGPECLHGARTGLCGRLDTAGDVTVCPPLARSPEAGFLPAHERTEPRGPPARAPDGAATPATPQGARSAGPAGAPRSRGGRRERAPAGAARRGGGGEPTEESGEPGEPGRRSPLSS